MNHKAKKSLGQNFLIDPNYKNKIIQSVKNMYSDEILIEIGPGKGALTHLLKDFASQMILIEKDDRLACDLVTRFKDDKTVKVIHADILKVEIDDICVTGRPYIVVGNLPYNISSQILIKLLIHNHYFKRLYLMFQKEVAMRCTASSGNKEYGMLAIWSQLYSSPKKLFHLPANVFFPRPKVVSSFLQFDILNRDYNEDKGFIEFVKVLFSQRRKKLSTSLKNAGFMDKSTQTENNDCMPTDIKQFLDNRIENLNLTQLLNLYNRFGL